MNNAKTTILKSLKSIGIKSVIKVSNLEIDYFDNEFNVYSIEDARTAGYIATGMSVEAEEPVFIAVGNDNDFRSLASAATEAFYRNIPVLVGVFKLNETSLNFEKDFRDTYKVIEHCTVESDIEEKIMNFRNHDLTLPGLVVFDLESENNNNDNIIIDQNILDEYDESDFVLISHNIQYTPNLISKIYINDGAGGLDGTISILLGASLSGKYNKYACVITESEMMHDLNSLGNRHFPTNITIFVKSEGKGSKQSVKDFANSLNIDFFDNKEESENGKSKIIWIERV